ncbi:ComEA family DNA-binding protein [Granulosicoccus antarcticus]|uniref:ComE operon protein 1 n=1 Tax=Granulosicoccus antarcticus IMCC3135 TaxID=1192854 RepID=A0A2Z2NXW1_9GAMM|nr:helix-hairpin-helix domain-containing protein [Granulosicoccus antarcticus]ASJ71984.1 hypothetical protein IMCC3135_09435 [Granulosicoccus antarcticus IMCC3135]
MANPIGIGDIDLNHTSMAEVIHSVALAIAHAQFELDRSSIVAAAALAGATTDGEAASAMVPFGREVNAGQLEPRYVSMVELGFVPTFYQFVDTVIDMKLSISLRRTRWDGGRTGQKYSSGTLGVTAKPVDANFSSTYNYRADLASSVRTKLVPIPPPPALEERINAQYARPDPVVAQGPNGLVDLNAADQSELITLEGIGKALAGRIVDARPFDSLDELEDIKGIDDQIIEGIRPSSRV